MGIEIGFYLIIIASLSWNMPKLWQVIFISWSIAILFLSIKIDSIANKLINQLTNKQNYKKTNKCFKHLLIIPSLLIITARLLPLLKNKIISTGFDTGYYRHYLAFKNAHIKNIPFYVIDKSQVIQKIMDIFRFFKISADFSFFAIAIIFSILSMIGVYLIGKKIHSEKTGLIGAFLFAVSPVQFMMFDYMLLKNIVGMSFFIWTIYLLLDFIDKSKIHKVICPRQISLGLIKLKETWEIVFILGLLFLIILTHRTTTFIGGITVLTASIIILIKKRKYIRAYMRLNIRRSIFIAAILIFLFGIVLFVNFSTLKMLIAEIFNGFKNLDPLVIKEGMFIEPVKFLILSIPILPFAILGYFKKIQEKNFDIFFIFASVCSAWIIFELIFYKRVIIFLDLALIFMAMEILADYLIASSPLEGLSGRSNAKTKGAEGGFSEKKFLFIIIPVLIISTSAITLCAAYADKPEISQNELSQIEQLNKYPQGTVLAVSSSKSPWIYGWTSHKITAPGLFDNHWPYNVWNEFWNDNNPQSFQRKKELLAHYAQNGYPLYIFTGENIPLPALPEECLNQINDYAWQWICRVN